MNKKETQESRGTCQVDLSLETVVFLYISLQSIIIAKLVPWLKQSHILQLQTNQKKMTTGDSDRKEYKESNLVELTFEEQIWR